MSLPLDVLPLVGEYDVGPLRVLRSLPPSKDGNGIYTPAVPAEFLISPIAAHTANGREVQQLPEADRQREAVVFYTLEAMHGADAGHTPDRVEYAGHWYKILTVADYQAQGLVWYSIGARLNPQEVVP